MEIKPEREGKTAAIIGYLMLVGAIIAIFLNLEAKSFCTLSYPSRFWFKPYVYFNWICNKLF